MNSTVARLVAVLGPQRFRIDADGDIEKLCSRCLRVYGPDEAWWPADPEFFTKDPDNGKAGLHSWCHACKQENRQDRLDRDRGLGQEERRQFARRLGELAGTRPQP